MKAYVVLVALFTLVPVGPVRAQEGNSNIIVLGGGKNAGAARAAIKRLKGMNLGPLMAGQGYPKVMKSAEVSGLKPGFHIAVFGFCYEEEAANAARDMLNLRFDGVYTKAVHQGFPPEACPLTPTGEPFEPPGTKLDKSESLHASHSWPKWQVYTGKAGPEGSNCTRAEVRVLGRGGMLAQAKFEPDSCSPPGEGTMDEFWSSAGFPVLGSRQFALLEHRQDWHDNGGVEYKLLHYGCGTVQVVATLQPAVPHPMPKITLPGKDWRDLTLVMTEGADTDTQRFRWNEKTCTFAGR